MPAVKLPDGHEESCFSPAGSANVIWQENVDAGAIDLAVTSTAPKEADGRPRYVDGDARFIQHLPDAHKGQVEFFNLPVIFSGAMPRAPVTGSIPEALTGDDPPPKSVTALLFGEKRLHGCRPLRPCRWSA